MTEPLRPPPGGTNSATTSDKVDTLPMNCDCLRCRLTALHGRLIAICGNTDGPVSDQIGEIAVELSEILLKGETACSSLMAIRTALIEETQSSAGMEQCRRL